MPRATPFAEEPLADEFDLSELLDDFREEAHEALSLLDADLAEREHGGTLPPEDHRALLRALHTLKGNAGMLGLRPIQHFVHSIEGVLKQPDERWPPGVLDRLLAGASALRRAVDRTGTPEQDEAFSALHPIRMDAVQEARVTDRRDPSPPSREEPSAPDPDEPRAESLRDEVLRIPFRRLDVLLNAIDEVSTAVLALEGWAAEHRAELHVSGLRRALLERIETLDLAAGAVRRSATRLRMVPVGRVFSRLPALARDLARDQGKRVHVVLEGEDTQLDKSTVDGLAEPLLHLVRNAVDHGVEPPEARVAAGKPAEATLTLRAAQEGDRVRVEVEDDGRGLDPETILARARENSLLSAGEEPTPAETAQLIFQPGFSTRLEASEVSGRGVGLDVVRSTVARMRGVVDVHPGPEGGTRFVLHLPLTVALIPALFFVAAGETLAVSVAQVDEAVRSPGVERVGAAEVVRLREEVIPLARAGRIFGWEESGGDSPFLIILRHAGRAVALAADRLLDQRSATVRALPASLGEPPGVSGATVAPDGRVILLLDGEAVIRMNVDLYRGGGFVE